MKKTILKVLASMLVLAMAITAIVIPSTTAQAADKETEIVLIFSKAQDGVVLLDFDNGGNTAKLQPQGEQDKTSLSSWGRTMYRFTQDPNYPNVYRMKVLGSVASGYANIQFVVAKNGSGSGAKYYPQDDRNTYNNNSKLFFNIDALSWQTLKPSTTDPFAASAADVMAEIDKIGTVTLSDDVKAKIETARGMVDAYSGNVSEITNLSKLTDAEAEWDRLVAAAAGELTLHVKTSWTSPKLYGWDGAAGGGLNSWPGVTIPADELNDGWYTITTTLTAPGSLIINNGSGSQTGDWKWVSAGEIWVTMSGTNYTPSTTAPAGWVTDKEEEPAPTPETTYHVVGLGGDNDWSNTDANKMTLVDGNYVYKKTLAAGKYEFKVHTSTDEWNPSGGNATFEVETECEITITFNPESKEIIVDGSGLKEKEPVPTYTIKVQVPAEWTSANWYAWDENDNNAAPWPGTALGEAVDGWYTIELPVTMTNLIINYNGEQTKDIKNIDPTKPVWVTVTGTGDDGFAVSYEAPQARGPFSRSPQEPFPFLQEPLFSFLR